jgi:hypothetical protein
MYMLEQFLKVFESLVDGVHKIAAAIEHNAKALEHNTVALNGGPPAEKQAVSQAEIVEKLEGLKKETPTKKKAPPPATATAEQTEVVVAESAAVKAAPPPALNGAAPTKPAPPLAMTKEQLNAALLVEFKRFNNSRDPMTPVFIEYGITGISDPNFKPEQYAGFLAKVQAVPTP